MSLKSFKRLFKNHATSEKNAFKAYKNALVTALTAIDNKEIIFPPINTSYHYMKNRKSSQGGMFYLLQQFETKSEAFGGVNCELYLICVFRI